MSAHLQIAEAGKQLHLTRDYAAALERYRAALHMAVTQNAPPVFAQHYTECILDALEASGYREQALELVERALSEPAETTGRLGQVVRAHMIQRRVLILFALDRAEDGDTALADAADLGGPVLAAVAEARRRRLTITPQWIADLRRKHGLDSVTKADLRAPDARAGERHFKKEFVNG